MYANRKILKCLLLTFVTLGVYGVYWFLCVTKEVKYYADDEYTFNGALLLLVSVFSFGIYTYYWAYRHDDNLFYACQKYNIEYTKNFFVYLFFVVVGLYFIPLMIMQYYVNQLNDSFACETYVKTENVQQELEYWQQPWTGDDDENED